MGKHYNPNRGLPRIAKYSGRLCGRVFYLVNGKQRSRGLGNMDKARVSVDPAFEGSRGASREMGASAKLSKVLRDGLGPGCFALGGRPLHCRLTAAIQKQIKGIPGQRGNGVIRVAEILPGLLGFRIRKNLGGFQVADLGFHHVDSSSGMRIWSFRGVTRPYLKELPKWVGYVRFSLIGVSVSDMVLNRDRTGYIAKRPEIHGLRQVRYSPLMEISAVSDFTWQVNLDQLFDGISLHNGGILVAVAVECFDRDLQVATQEASAPFGSLPVGWDSGWVPEGEQSLRKFMGKKRVEAGLRYRAMEVVLSSEVVDSRSVEAEQFTELQVLICLSLLATPHELVAEGSHSYSVRKRLLGIDPGDLVAYGFVDSS